MGIIPNLGFLKRDSSGFMILALSTNCAVIHLLYPQCHMSSKKHSNAAGQSSRGSASKGRMQLTSYLWKKIGMLWKNYGKPMEFSFPGICTNPVQYGIIQKFIISEGFDFLEKSTGKNRHSYFWM